MGAITYPQPTSPPRVRLAEELPLRIGSLHIDPPTRQIGAADRTETLEPRVMQVLVALARASGRVVSRDELVKSCWEGRAISDDAIHRVLSRLRQVAADLGDETLRIETTRGVGYRLTETSPRLVLPALRAVRMSRRSIVGGTAAAAIAAVAGLWLLPRRTHEPLPQALQYYQRGLETRGQASIEISEQGAALFREATRIDPQFADAWGALAWSYRGLLEYGPRPDASRLRAIGGGDAILECGGEGDREVTAAVRVRRARSGQRKHSARG